MSDVVTVSVNGIIIERACVEAPKDAGFFAKRDTVFHREDEFVSLQNASGGLVDASGMQLWVYIDPQTEMNPEIGNRRILFHEFASGSVLAPGEGMCIFNGAVDLPGSDFVSASHGVPSTGSDDANGIGITGIALVDPASGTYVALELNVEEAFWGADMSGEADLCFSGQHLIGKINVADELGHSAPNAVTAFKYDPGTDRYQSVPDAVACFASGTQICTPDGLRTVDSLKPGDLIWTQDGGARPVAIVLKRRVDFGSPLAEEHRPIAFAPGSLGCGTPERTLVLSPKHRVWWRGAGREEHLIPAQAFLGRAGVSVQQDCASVEYYQIVMASHEVIMAEGAWVETYYPGAQSLKSLHPKTRERVTAVFDAVCDTVPILPARKLLTVGAAHHAFEQQGLVLAR